MRLRCASPLPDCLPALPPRAHPVPIPFAPHFLPRHPQYGGDRRNNVVEALFRAFPAAGMAALRFDFRGVGRSTGDFANGQGEKNDLLAALDFLAETFPGVPLIAAGSSFGSLVALGTDHPGVVAYIVVAPPLRVGVARPFAADDPRPTLLLPPEEDQFAPAVTLPSICADWNNATIVPVSASDHFLAGRTAWVADRAIEFANGVLHA